MTPPLLPLTDQDIEAIERATLDAVAPPAVEQLDDWLLPFDTSTIGRAISAVPLRHHEGDATVVRAIATRYAARGMAAAFRVADVPGLAVVRAELARLGWRAQQATLVQVVSVARMLEVCAGPAAEVRDTADAAWAAPFLTAGFDLVDGANRIQALRRARNAVYATLCEGDQTLACGTVAFGFGWASIHGMRTLATHRGQGLAARVLAGLADAARGRGLQRVFLQVEADNTAALRLYHRAGFSTAWRYHYWRPAPS
ncbi:MAG: hypothetical protein RLZ81_2082 [Pseudomonadota bacterium]|jgi:ribosomal protein S18 acetylase RimI-like enzyme